MHCVMLRMQVNKIWHVALMIMLGLFCVTYKYFAINLVSDTLTILM